MAIIKKFRIKYFKKQKPIIKIDKLSFSFGKRKILDNVSFGINGVGHQDGEVEVAKAQRVTLGVDESLNVRMVDTKASHHRPTALPR